MKDIEIINIDYSGENSQYRETESFTESDIPTPFVIPDKSPFYTRNFVLKGNGKVLLRNVDFVFEDYLEEIELITGRTTCASIRLLKKTLEDYKTFTIEYNRVGDPVIGRQYLLDSAEKIINNDTKVDWNTQVFGKPDTYPPSFHLHDIREKDEIVGFSDLVVLFKQFRGQQVKHGLDIWNRLLRIREACYTDLDNIYKERLDEMFEHIQNSNVPHPMTKADIGLGNHPNYHTATEQQDIDGTLSNALSTPNGLSKALENYDVNSDGYLRQGSLPFSYYGTGIYIPPPISGSFEGLGTSTGGSAFCVESNGWTVALTRGFDSKVRQLYYYYNRNIYDDNENFIFSGFAYQSQVMANNGHTPNHILSGSDPRILVIGDKEAGAYYVTLANGTLDANSHQLYKIDMNSFVDSDGVNMWEPDHNYVMFIGDYVYIIGQKDVWAPNIPEDQRFGWPDYRRRSFYRIPVSALTSNNGGTVTFVKQLMNFQNSEGEWAYNQEFVDLAKNVTERDGNGNLVLKRCVIGYDVPPTNAGTGYPWRCQFFNMQNPNNKNQAALKVFHNARFMYVGETQVSDSWGWCLPYNFDTITNTLTLDSRFFLMSRNFITNQITVPEGRDYLEWYHPEIYQYVAGHSEISAAFIPKLGFASFRTTDHNLPYDSLIGFFGYNPNKSNYKPDLSDWDIFNQDLRMLNQNGYRSKRVALDSPFGFTTKPCIQTDLWEYNGSNQSLPVEIFRALNTNGDKATYARATKNSYQYKQDSIFNFKYIPNTVIGRTPSTSFMEVTAGNLSSVFTSRMPVVGVSSKDKHGTQYGLVNISNLQYNESNNTFNVNGGLYYSDTSGGSVVIPAGSEGFYLSLLGKHTVDVNNKKLTIEKIPTESVFITKTVWMDILKRMLGSNSSIIDNNGKGIGGDWILSLYIGSKSGTGNDVFPSVAILSYHTWVDPANTKAVIMTFNWTQSGTKSGGEKIIAITNIKYPNSAYGPGGTLYTMDYAFDTSGHWGGWDFIYTSECLNTTMFMDFTDANNYDFWFQNGINGTVPFNGSSTTARMTVANGASTFTEVLCRPTYLGSALYFHRQLVTDYGICQPLAASESGGAALYVQGGKIPNGQYCLMQAVFIEGNWTLFVNTDIVAVFNGSEKTLLKTNYDLSALGIDQTNKTFYLYAMSGKTLGYYDLTLSERTASPYHLLVATIKTNSFGIEQIQVEQRFAISGFTISTNRKGGIVPASSGTVSENGTFKTVTYDDLFNQNNYN